MAGSVNKVILIGNLGSDPEIRHTQDGRSVGNLRLATTDSWRDKQSGERREKTEWHSVVVFNTHLVDNVIKKFLKKGMKVYIEGQLQTRKWQDNAGNDRYTTEVVLQNYNGQITLLDGKKGGGDASSEASEYDDGGSSSQSKTETKKPPEKDFDDEIPF
jgi:single-strand DNA-binding protein